MIIEYFGYKYLGAKIDYTIETSPLGTGGGLLLAIDKITENEPFLLLNGDTYFSLSLPHLIDFANQKNADFTFSLFRTYDKERYMGVEIDNLGRVTCLKNKSSKFEYHLASGGVYWVKNINLIASFRKLKMSLISFEDQILPSIYAAKRNIFGLEFGTTFIDIGVPVDYLRASLVLTQNKPDTLEDIYT